MKKFEELTLEDLNECFQNSFVARIETAYLSRSTMTGNAIFVCLIRDTSPGAQAEYTAAELIFEYLPSGNLSCDFAQVGGEILGLDD